MRSYPAVGQLVILTLDHAGQAHIPSWDVAEFVKPVAGRSDRVRPGAALVHSDPDNRAREVAVGFVLDAERRADPCQ